MTLILILVEVKAENPEMVVSKLLLHQLGIEMHPPWLSRKGRN